MNKAIKMSRRQSGIIAVAAALTLGGCANSGSPLTTASLTAQKPAAVAKVDPTCVALSNKIAGMRKEGTMDRLAKVSTGKTRSTMVKRTSLAKAAELDKANAEFQAKCAKYQTTAAATTPAADAVKAAAAAAAAKKAKSAATSAATKAAKKIAPKAVKKTIAASAASAAANAAVKKK